MLTVAGRLVVYRMLAPDGCIDKRSFFGVRSDTCILYAYSPIKPQQFVSLVPSMVWSISPALLCLVLLPVGWFGRPLGDDCPPWLGCRFLGPVRDAARYMFAVRLFDNFSSSLNFVLMRNAVDGYAG